MIAYDLQCSQGHVFEGWFDDREAYKSQQQNGLLICPVCNDETITRLPSVFAVKTASSPENTKDTPEDAGHKLLDFVETNFENVGCDFAREALKIHYGVSEPRNIRGVSTDKEEKMLREEGIRFFKMPIPGEADTGAKTPDSDSDS